MLGKLEKSGFERLGSHRRDDGSPEDIESEVLAFSNLDPGIKNKAFKTKKYWSLSRKNQCGYDSKWQIPSTT